MMVLEQFHSGGWNWFVSVLDTALYYAPLATGVSATAATVAGFIAWRQLINQRNSARKRAAVDFFLKTEMDQTMLTAYEKSRVGMGQLKDGKRPDIFVTTDDCKSVRAYLNIYELLAVGIHGGIFDEEVCYQYWGDEIITDGKSARDFITFIQEEKIDATYATYRDLLKLSKDWADRDAREQPKTGEHLQLQKIGVG